MPGTLPKKVEEYADKVREGNPDYDESRVWATAWSIYCKYRNDDHCKMDADSYLTGKGASLTQGALRLASQNEALRPVLLRAVQSSILAVGDTIELKKSNVRVHRFRTAIRVWDLTNAGKRGKTVSAFAVYDVDRIAEEEAFDKLYEFIGSLEHLPTYESILGSAEGLLDFQPKIQKYTYRGIDIAPAGFKPIKMLTPNVLLESGWESFSVRDIKDKQNESTCISKGKKKDINAFYRWVTENSAAIERMSFDQILNAMGKAGIDYHTYCAMD